jgi:pantoate--beta-alanine ligase
VTAGRPIPVLARTRNGLAAARAALAAPVVLVPTMGALHDGHRSPLRLAHALAGSDGSVLVSIFVNPLQFGPLEDFDRYPRSLERDLAICAEEGVQAVFAPSRPEMYPAEPMVTVDPGQLGRVLEGKSRPGFFDGVLTVVLKLFQLTQPDAAVFGEKDAQQLVLIRRMAADLELGVQVAAAPLHRDPDGLAASSRNGYLSGPERASALALPRALAAARSAASAWVPGSPSGGAAAPAAARGAAATALAAARAVLDQAAADSPPVQLDYLVLAEPDTLAEVDPGYTGPAVLLVAAQVGSTRLIDNARVMVGGLQEPAGVLDSMAAGAAAGGSR